MLFGNRFFSLGRVLLMLVTSLYLFTNNKKARQRVRKIFKVVHECEFKTTVKLTYQLFCLSNYNPGIAKGRAERIGKNKVTMFLIEVEDKRDIKPLKRKLRSWLTPRYNATHRHCHTDDSCTRSNEFVSRLIKKKGRVPALLKAYDLTMVSIINQHVLKL